MKYLSVGLPKSGTTTIHRAMTELGFSSRHSPQAGRQSLRYIQGHNQKPAWWDDTDIVGDGPLWQALHYFPRLVERHDLRVIATVRDVESWITSTLIHVLHNRLGGPGNWVNVDCSEKRRTYERAMDLLDRVKGDPRVLVLRLPLTSWEPLCEFVGRPVPSKPFPRANSGAEKLRAMAEWKEAH